MSSPGLMRQDKGNTIMTEQTAPRIYAACLASYNSGRLYGAWIDCADKSGDEIAQEIARMLKGSPYPNVERRECKECGHVQRDRMLHPECDDCGGEMSEAFPSAEEWAIHDHEGFAGMIKGENPDLDEVAAMATGLASGDRLGFLWLVNDHGMKPSEAVDEAENVQVYQSDKHDLASEYAYDLASDTIEDFDAKSSQWPFTCIDWEHAGRELVLGGDVAEFEADGERMLITNPGDF